MAAAREIFLFQTEEITPNFCSVKLSGVHFRNNRQSYKLKLIIWPISVSIASPKTPSKLNPHPNYISAHTHIHTQTHTRAQTYVPDSRNFSLLLYFPFIAYGFSKEINISVCRERRVHQRISLSPLRTKPAQVYIFFRFYKNICSHLKQFDVDV